MCVWREEGESRVDTGSDHSSNGPDEAGFWGESGVRI